MFRRQAGAVDEVSAALCDLKAKAAALRFGSQQDAFDYIAHSKQNMARLGITENVKPFDGYAEGKLECRVCFFARGSNCQYQFLFKRAPYEIAAIWAHDLTYQDSLNFSSREEGNGLANAGRNEGAVFLGVTEVVNSPEGVVPSFVWVTPPKECSDLRRQVSADVSGAINIVVQIGETVCEGEIGLPRIFLPASNRGGVTGLVEHGPQIVGCIEKNTGKHMWEVESKLNFVDVVSRIRIFIDNVGPRLAFDKFVNQRIEITDVMLCPNESKTRAVEQICHGQDRSVERPGIPESGASLSEYSAAAP
jgi:hypothetical protein